MASYDSKSFLLDSLTLSPPPRVRTGSWSGEPDGSGYCRAVIDRLLQQTVISSLRRAHPDAARPFSIAGDASDAAAPEIDAADIGAFAHELGHGSQRSVDDMAESLAQRDGGVEGLLIDVLPQVEALLRTDAARTPSQSTLGQWRLQEMLERLSPRFQSTGSVRAHGTRILLTALEPEMQALRLPLAAECFLRDGWNVTCARPEDSDRLAGVVARNWFAVVAVTADTAGVDMLAPLLRSLRAAACNPGMRALVISEALSRRPDRMARLGADAAAGDLRHACVQAGRLRGLVPR